MSSLLCFLPLWYFLLRYLLKKVGKGATPLSTFLLDLAQQLAEHIMLGGSHFPRTPEGIAPLASSCVQSCLSQTDLPSTVGDFYDLYLPKKEKTFSSWLRALCIWVRLTIQQALLEGGGYMLKCSQMDPRQIFKQVDWVGTGSSGKHGRGGAATELQLILWIFQKTWISGFSCETSRFIHVEG